MTQEGIGSPWRYADGSTTPYGGISRLLVRHDPKLNLLVFGQEEGPLSMRPYRYRLTHLCNLTLGREVVTAQPGRAMLMALPSSGMPRLRGRIHVQNADKRVDEKSGKISGNINCGTC